MEQRKRLFPPRGNSNNEILMLNKVTLSIRQRTSRPRRTACSVESAININWLVKCQQFLQEVLGRRKSFTEYRQIEVSS